METILKQLLSTFMPVLVQYALDNRHILVDFLTEEAKKTDNSLDDYVVGIITDYINSL